MGFVGVTMITICPVCVEGKVKIPNGDCGNEPLGTCLRCNGDYVQRDPPEGWTKVEDLPEDVLRQMASVRHHCRVDFDNGLLHFVEYEDYPIPRDPGALLKMIVATSKLGAVLKEHNWKVRY